YGAVIVSFLCFGSIRTMSVAKHGVRSARNNSGSRILRGVFIGLEGLKDLNQLDVLSTIQKREIESGTQEGRNSSMASLFAIGNRKSKIENIVVPVVQRIERRFPKP